MVVEIKADAKELRAALLNVIPHTDARIGTKDQFGYVILCVDEKQDENRMDIVATNGYSMAWAEINVDNSTLGHPLNGPGSASALIRKDVASFLCESLKKKNDKVSMQFDMQDNDLFVYCGSQLYQGGLNHHIPMVNYRYLLKQQTVKHSAIVPKLSLKETIQSLRRTHTRCLLYTSPSPRD